MPNPQAQTKRVGKPSLLVTLIEKAVRPLEGEVVQVVAAPVQYPSKTSWDAQAHNEHPRRPQKQSCPEVVPRKTDL